MIINNKNKLISSKGFSLLEVLLAAALSMSLCIIIFYSYTTVRRLYLLNIDLNQMQNTAYFAETILAQDIRTAGFIGCVKLAPDLIIQHPSDINFTESTILQGYESNHLPADLRSIAKTIVPDTDSIIIEKMSDQINPINKHNGYIHNELFIASDCNNAKIIRYSANHFKSSFAGFSNLSQVAPLEKIIYYIGITTRTTSSGEPIYALYRKDLWRDKNQQIEIIDGVENMQIRYAVKSSYNNTLNYFSSSQITDWSRVIAVKVYLLVVSSHNVNYINQASQFMGEKLITTDKRLHREWTMIIALRER